MAELLKILKIVKLKHEWTRKNFFFSIFLIIISYNIAVFCSFVDELDNIVTGKKPVTLILDDPTGNSYVQSLSDDGTLDDKLKITKYTRSYEQDEELGINDMKTENY